MLRLSASRTGMCCALAGPRPTVSAVSCQLARRQQSFSTTKQHLLGQNRVYAPIRNLDGFDTALSLSTSQDRTLVTLWTASWCRSCEVVGPLVTRLVQDGAGQDQADGVSVAYAEIEFDSPDMSSVAERFVITSVPTLVSFRRGLMQEGPSRVTDVKTLKDEAFLRAWLDREARAGWRGGTGGVGGSSGGGGGSVFGGLFGSWFGGRT